MLSIKKTLFILLTMMPFLSHAQQTNHNERTNYGEASLETMRTLDLLTILDFMNKNKTMDIQDVAGICSLPNQINMYGSEHRVMDKLLSNNGLDKSYFVKIGYVNIDCGDTNFIIDAMARDSTIFVKWLDYGFDLNRPVQYKGMVGTPIDIGFYNLNRAEKEKKGLWRKNISYLKKRGFKSCKELGIKCSIDS